MSGRRPTSARGGRTIERGELAYGELSRRPLHILAFLAPLIVAYEIGTVLYLTDRDSGIVETIVARQLLSAMFEAVGGVWVYLPGIALAAVLFIWHLLRRDPWWVRGRVLLGMLGESVLWVLPLLVLGLIFQSRAVLMETVSEDSLRTLEWQARLTLSLGAGIYEELLFRLIMVTLVHMAVVDLLRFSDGVGNVVAVVASGLAFAAYHDVRLASGGVDPVRLAFFGLAGMYFAALYLLRGFGVCVGVHAAYDVVVLVALTGGAAAAQPAG